MAACGFMTINAVVQVPTTTTAALALAKIIAIHSQFISNWFSVIVHCCCCVMELQMKWSTLQVIATSDLY